MAGVLSMLRDVYLLLRVVVKLDRSLLDTKILGLSLDQQQHLCGSLMFFPTLSRMYVCVWRCTGGLTVFIYVFDGVSCVQSSIHMCLDIVPICLRYSGVCWLDKETLASWHILYMWHRLSNIFAVPSLPILSSQHQSASFIRVLSSCFPVKIFVVTYWTNLLYTFIIDKRKSD